MRGLLAGALALLLTSTAVAAPKSKAKIQPAPPPPPFAGVYQPQGVDEIGLWREADEDERKLSQSAMVISDEALNQYIRKILCATVGDDRCGATRIYILRIPDFGAAMSPNGTMLVYSGLLLRARTESELAAVLAHEFGHFERRHGLERFKARRTGSDILAWGAVIASMSSNYQVHRSYRDLNLSVTGSIFRFGRNQEREADLLGLGYLNVGTHRPQAASRIWRNLILEAEASAAARGLRKPDFDRISFFDSHPPEGERADYLYALAMADGEGRDEGAARYNEALAQWTTMFLDDQIALNDFGASEFIINRIAESGWTDDLWRARGDLYRARGNPRDLMNAADFYSNAVALNSGLALAQRGLGLSLIKTGRFTEGRAALERYLQLLPEATDIAMIQLTLKSIGDSK